MSNDWEFTEDEIKDKLAELGYNHIPREKLKEFATGKVFESCTSFDLCCQIG